MADSLVRRAKHTDLPNPSFVVESAEGWDVDAEAWKAFATLVDEVVDGAAPADPAAPVSTAGTPG